MVEDGRHVGSQGSRRARDAETLGEAHASAVEQHDLEAIRQRIHECPKRRVLQRYFDVSDEAWTYHEVLVAPADRRVRDRTERTLRETDTWPFHPVGRQP